MSFGISRSTLYVLMKSGRIRTIKVGRRRLIPEDEGARLLKEARPRHASPLSTSRNNRAHGRALPPLGRA